MNRSRAVVFAAPQCVELQDVDTPAPQAGEVLIETHSTLISTGTELTILKGQWGTGTHWDQWIHFSMTPGYCQCGRIVALGEGVEDFQVGQRVASRGAHAEFVASPVGNTFPVPDGIGDEVACWAALAMLVQHGFRKAQLQLGESAVIVGLGLLGQLMVQYARVAGARHVIAVDTNPFRLEMARANGATHCLLDNAETAREKVNDITGGGADIVWDITGNAAAFASCSQLPRRFGRLVLLGDASSPAQQHLSHHILLNDLQILGAHAHNPPPQSSDYARWSNAAMVQVFFDLQQRDLMDVLGLVTHRFAPSEAYQAYSLLQTSNAPTMGVIFDWRRA